MAVNVRQDRDKTGPTVAGRVEARDMSIESSLLVVAVVCIALYVLAALVLPERF